MYRHILTAALLGSAVVLAGSCQIQSPIAPSPSDLVNQFLQSLRQQGLTVMLTDDAPRELHPFFSPRGQQVLANDGRVTVYEYPSADAAAREAAVVSPDGQPSPSAIIEWISTPRFYRMDRLIALYVGCSTEIVRALDTTMGSAFVIGGIPCRRAD